MDKLDLKTQLDKLSDYMDNNDTKGYNSYLKQLYQTLSTDEKDFVTSFIEEKLRKSTEKVGAVVKDAQIRLQLADSIEVLPLSYIAKTYFGRTKGWLYQRINGNAVNGKPARFTPNEINTFNHAIQDISKKIGSINIA